MTVKESKTFPITRAFPIRRKRRAQVFGKREGERTEKKKAPRRRPIGDM